MNDNELLAKSSYWLTIILGNLYLRRWKIFWLEIFIIIILLYLCIKLEHFIKNQLNLDEVYTSLTILLLTVLIFRINCIIAIINARKLIRNS